MCELPLPFAEQCFVLKINLNLLRLQALSYQHGTKTKIQARLLYKTYPENSKNLSEIISSKHFTLVGGGWQRLIDCGLYLWDRN